MHRYFLIPMISFFIIIFGFVIYLQYFNEDWKFIAPKIVLPDSCNDFSTDVELVIHSEDYVANRSFEDSPDTIKGNQFHIVFLLPCERQDRGFDVKLYIESSILAINKWFEEKTSGQTIKFDINHKGNLDITFLRVNKTMNWFIDNNLQQNKNKTDVSNKIFSYFY